MRRFSLPRTLGVLGVLVVSLSLACSQHEVQPSGPPPEAPKEARAAKPVASEGAGMNPMPQEEPAPAPRPEGEAPAGGRATQKP